MKSLSKLKNNKGMSLVELIISVAIVSIVIGVIFSFMVTGSRIFTASSSEINMQQDSQLVLNNIENRVLDAQLGAYFDQEKDASNNVIFTKLTILNATGREYIYWDGNKNTVYYDSDTVDIEDADSIDTKASATLLSSTTKEVIAENVESFFVEFKDTKINDSDKPKAKAYVQLTMKEKDKTGKERGIESNKTISFRNKIDTSVPSEKQLYIDAKKERVSITSVKVTPNEVEMVVPSEAGAVGTPKKFTARVSGVGHPSQLVSWSIEGNPAGVSVSQEGIVTVTNEATVSSVFVVATATNGEDTESGKAEINLKKITGLTVSTQSEYYADTFIKLKPTLAGVGIEDSRFKKFSYNITSTDGKASDILVYSEDNGLLYLGPNTQGKTYKITVTSDFDSSKVAVVDFTVQDTELVASGSGNAVATRGASVELLESLTLNEEHLAQNELNISWEITDSAGLDGKVSVNKRGEFTAAKNINYEKDYFVEVKATISASRLLNPVTKLIKVKIPAVTLHFTNSTGTIKKNSTETYKLEATGLVLAPEDVYVATNPALSNCIVYPTKEGVQVSLGNKIKDTTKEFDLVATLKNTNTSTSMKITIAD